MDVMIDSVAKLEAAIEAVKAAQVEYGRFPQEKVDEIFKAAALAANKHRLPLAKLAVEETSMGVVEDKVIKNNYAAEYIYNAYKDTKTCGIVEEDETRGIVKIAEPLVSTIQKRVRNVRKNVRLQGMLPVKLL